MRKPSRPKPFQPAKIKYATAKPPRAINRFEAGNNQDLALSALQRGTCLTFNYLDCYRVVGVFTVGNTQAGRPAMSAWQIDGQSNSYTIPDWGLFCFDECFDVALSDLPSPPPPSDYSKGAKQFKRIIAEF